jgi:1-acyl-sn-glycerol-3-phosphate acyltransferase
MMAIDAGVPIVPITVSGASRIMPKGQIKIHPSTVKIIVHEPIDTKGYSKGNIEELIEKTRTSIFSALNDEERAMQGEAAQLKSSSRSSA